MDDALRFKWRLAVDIDLREQGLVTLREHQDAIKKLERELASETHRIIRLSPQETEVGMAADTLVEILDRTGFEGYTREWRLMRAAVYAMRVAQGRTPAKPIERWCVVDGDCHYTHDNEKSARKHAKERGGLRVVHLREVTA